MLVGVLVALGWRYLEYHSFLSDVVPGLLSALLVHELLARILLAAPVAHSNEANQQPVEGQRVANR